MTAHLDLSHFRLIRAVAETGTLTGAGAVLNLSQPALSHRLRLVEDRLGAPLFERRAKRMHLTPAGARLLRTAQRVVAEVEAAERDARLIAEGRAGTLGFGVQCYTCFDWLPPVLRAFAVDRPGIDLRIAGAQSDSGQALRDGRLDLALLSWTEGMGDGIVLEEAFTDEIVALVPSGHPWAGKPHLEAADFAGADVIADIEPFERTDLSARLLRPAGVEVGRVTTLNGSTDAVAGLVAAGFGVATLSHWAARRHIAQGDLVCLRLTAGGLERRWSVARRDEPAPPFLEDFSTRIAKAARTHLGWSGDAAAKPMAGMG